MCIRDRSRRRVRWLVCCIGNKNKMFFFHIFTICVWTIWIRCALSCPKYCSSIATTATTTKNKLPRWSAKQRLLEEWISSDHLIFYYIYIFVVYRDVVSVFNGVYQVSRSPVESYYVIGGAISNENCSKVWIVFVVGGWFKSWFVEVVVWLLACSFGCFWTCYLYWSRKGRRVWNIKSKFVLIALLVR